MGLFEIKPRHLETPLALHPGYFGLVDSTYILPTSPIPAGAALMLEALPVSCMFKVYRVTQGGQDVGYGFSSAFKVSNRGSYLLTRVERAAKPETFNIALRLPTLVLLHFPNTGSLAISPRVSTAVANIFLEQ